MFLLARVPAASCDDAATAKAVEAARPSPDGRRPWHEMDGNSKELITVRSRFGLSRYYSYH
jgi:hypothetical protein